MKLPILSVIIVNFNGAAYVKECIDSILKNNIKNFEIVIVDNGSTEKELSKLKVLEHNHKEIKIVALHKNFGPALARNIGVINSHADLIAFLDNDTQVEPNWANNAIKYFKMNPKVGIIQSKLLLANDHSRLDYVGEYLGSNGFLVQNCKAGDLDSISFSKPQIILAAKSAGMFIRRNVFNLINGFDDDYFIYVEETDLGWRSWLAGFESHFLPTSKVYHQFGTSSVILGLDKASQLAKYHGPKNYLSTLIKNLSLVRLVQVLPIHLTLWLGLILYRFITLKPNDSIQMLKGLAWVILNIDKILIKRSLIQKKRKVDDNFVFKKLVVNRNLWYFVSKAVLKSKVGNAQSY